MAAMSKFAILLGGDVTPTPRLAAQISGARVIAADSGMRHASALGVRPELWVGDFDSSDAALVSAHRDVERVAYPAAKDATDGELATQVARKRGATEIVFVGAFGGQFDHALAHVAQLVGLAENNVKAFATSGNEEAWPLTNRVSLWQIARGARLSLVGLTAMKGLTITGVRWALQNQDVPMGSTLTLSNEVAGDVAITLKEGRGVVLLYPLIKR
jgi:thiamine pyrophosphokinase